MHFRKRIESSNKSEEKLRKKEQGPIWEAVAVVSVIDMRCCTKVMGERERAQTEDTGPNQHRSVFVDGN